VVDIDAATITVLIAVVGCLVGLANWNRNMKLDAESLAAIVKRIETSVNHTEEQIQDLKADLKIYKETADDAYDKVIKLENELKN
jgi:septal ring factor EnvC (AmiA/AmiB activator)